MQIGHPIRALPGLWFNLMLISGMWGSSFLFIKLINNSVPTLLLRRSSWLYCNGSIIGLAGGAQKPNAPERATFRAIWLDFQHIVVLGTTNGWLANVMTVTALRYLDSVIVAIVLATVPLLVVVLAHFLLAKRDSKSLDYLGYQRGSWVLFWLLVRLQCSAVGDH